MLLAFAAMGVVGGVWLIIASFSDGPPATHTSVWQHRLTRLRAAAKLTKRDQIAAGVGALAGLLLAFATGFLLLIVLVPIATVVVPRMFGKTKAKTRIETLEALKDWTKILAGTLSTRNALEQAIVKTGRSTPEAIRPQVHRLITRIRSRWSTKEALSEFADEIDDPVGDLIVAALIANAERRGPGLLRVLDSLADSVREEVAARRKVETERATSRVAIKYVSIITVLALVALVLRNDLGAFASGTGLIVAIGMIVSYALAFVWFRKLANGNPPPRILGGTR